MKKIIILFIVFITGIIIYSCNKNYLEKRAPGQLDDASLANLHGVEGLLIGAYSLLDGSGGNKSDITSAASNWTYGSICGSEAYSGGGGPGDGGIQTIELFNTIATDGLVASKWGVVYDGVSRCNDVLRMMKRASDISATDQKRIEAEARFLRAHYHFEAKKMWDKVPFVDETITYEAGNYRVANDKDIWPDIENDLRYAMDNLDETPYNNEAGRADRFTAMALLAKAYMFEHKFQDAKPLLENIINSGRYRLTKKFHDNFDPAKKNNEESIFSAQESVNDGAGGANGNMPDLYNFPGTGGDVPGGCCGFFQPSQYLVNHFKTDSVTGLPDLEHFNDVNVKYDSALQSGEPFEPYTGTLDPRIDWTVGRRGIPYLDWGINPGNDWIRNANNGGPYLPLKNIYAKSQQRDYTDNNFWASITTAMNVNLIRFADVLLWAAEVEAETGTLEQAENYVNQIRTRMTDSTGWVHTYVNPDDPSKGFTGTPAANYRIKPYPDGDFAAKGKEYALKAIRYERMLELAMEGHRFFDLVRWQIAAVEINNYFNKEKNMRSYMNDANFRPDCNEYFPIPQLQIDLSIGGDGVKKMTQSRSCYQ